MEFTTEQFGQATREVFSGSVSQTEEIIEKHGKVMDKLDKKKKDVKEIIGRGEKLAEMAKNSPASPDIITTAAKITGAGAVSCTPTEAAALTAVQTDLDDAVAKIGTALAAVQEQLESKLFLYISLCSTSHLI